jgi:microcystin-dependent protein
MKRPRIIAVSFVALCCCAAPAQSDYYLGQSILVGFNFCPQGFADANGQLLPVAQNQALFGLYQTTYGGDGKNTFALPDLRGRIPINQGDAAGLPPAKQGDSFGTDATTLTTAQMPPHSHDVQASQADSTTGDPAGNLLTNGNIKIYDTTQPPSVPMAKEMVGLAGGFKPFDQHQPTLVIHYCIALQGVLPPKP